MFFLTTRALGQKFFWNKTPKRTYKGFIKCKSIIIWTKYQDQAVQKSICRHYFDDNCRTDNIQLFEQVNQNQLEEVQMKQPKVYSRLYLDDLTKKMTCKLYSSLVKALQECGNGVWSVWPLFYETFSFLLKAQYILV